MSDARLPGLPWNKRCIYTTSVKTSSLFETSVIPIDGSICGSKYEVSMATKSSILAKDSDNRFKDKHQLTGIVRRIVSGLMRKFSE